MKRIETLVFGIYPKSEKLRIRIGRWERHLISTYDLENEIRQETEQVESQWAESGLTHWAAPLFNWYDIFRPFSTMVSGIRLGPLTRYLETNTFYRIPVLDGPIALKTDPGMFAEGEEGLPLPLYQSRSEWAFLPGLMTFQSMSEISGAVNEEFIERMLTVYRQIIEKTGKKKLFLFEVSDPGKFDYSLYRQIMKPSDTVLFFSKSPGKDNLSSISERFYSLIDASGSSSDLVADHSMLKGIALLDAHSTRVESRDLILEKVENTGEETLLTSNDYLDFLPRVIADRKVSVLGGCSNVR